MAKHCLVARAVTANPVEAARQRALVAPAHAHLVTLAENVLDADPDVGHQRFHHDEETQGAVVTARPIRPRALVQHEVFCEDGGDRRPLEAIQERRQLVDDRLVALDVSFAAHGVSLEV